MRPKRTKVWLGSGTGRNDDGAGVGWNGSIQSLGHTIFSSSDALTRFLRGWQNERMKDGLNCLIAGNHRKFVTCSFYLFFLLGVFLFLDRVDLLWLPVSNNGGLFLFRWNQTETMRSDREDWIWNGTRIMTLDNTQFWPIPDLVLFLVFLRARG